MTFWNVIEWVYLILGVKFSQVEKQIFLVADCTMTNQVIMNEVIGCYGNFFAILLIF
jgi:hypothetical protein